jgi:hypothetical protein
LHPLDLLRAVHGNLLPVYPGTTVTRICETSTIHAGGSLSA